MTSSACDENDRGLGWLLARLDALHSTVDETSARELLAQASLTPQEVARYIEPQPGSYARRAVVRKDEYELLVLTWMPGQGSVAHDHAGSLCGLKVVQGALEEQLYEAGPDGQVRPTAASRLGPSEITVDPGVIIHSLSNPADSGQILVTVHLYSPPLPEVRRYAVAEKPPAPAFVSQPQPDAPVIAIIGGGFTGTMTAANLLRRAQASTNPLHIVLIDKQPAVGEGIAYRTNDSRHLLNVPVEKMSAWHDCPDDFLNFARARDSSIKPGDFLPRKLYGQYVRQTFLETAEAAANGVSVEIVRDTAARLRQTSSKSGWTVATTSGRSIQADLAIITLGHRPPAEEFIRRWQGPRTRFIADPWAALVLSQIAPDEPVLILGSGLTAVDAILTVDHPNRTAPLTVVSRHGFLPQIHARKPKPPEDLSSLVGSWLDSPHRPKARALVRDIRQQVRAAVKNGVDWRQVIDGLRPHVAKIWGRLNEIERASFFRRIRPFWEIHRHRMAPAVADRLASLQERKIIDLTAGSLVAAEADDGGISVTLNCRGKTEPRRIRVSWVINCTGPGVHHRRSTHPILRPLIESGAICDDPLGLGIRTDNEGRAINTRGETHSDLLIAGTLRKSTLWESTAVPELRQQAATVAEVALQALAPH